ncbi:hypothetical protein ACLHDD_02215 [Pantoea sp. NSTU24]|uniref:hypothetical protein n=1 Tax=Pantoea sp. NSTU24 TaxID=3391144 RepID=UPI003D046DB1
MTKFEQLREEVSTRSRMEREYWDSLQEAVIVFRNGFYNYLGLESNEIDDGKGHKAGIVQVGRVKDGKFEMCAPWAHEKDGKKLSFILFLMLPDSESMEVAMTSWTKITVSKPFYDEDAINISTQDMYQPVLCTKENDKLSLEPFYDELFSELVRKISIESL